MSKGSEKRTPHSKSIMRFAISLAIREHAGRRLQSGEITNFAYLLCVRRETLEGLLKLSAAWLQGLTGDGERAFLKARGNLHEERHRMQATRQRRPVANVA